ncbi:MAG: signal recognition particle protein [Deltaproteobacteria bacterium]|nr:signal recognition particle protein [Deltaproteobacteria bacterium]MBW2070944.1 signal recognition particle protein [Deltaproteobacteria bacterium]
MFESLSEKFNRTLKRLKGQGKLSEKNIKEALREVRLALLEADVHYKVAKQFVADIAERAVGSEVMDSLTPGQQLVKIVNDELTRLMGTEAVPLQLSGRTPLIYMLVGLQGSGKTTTAGKLALYLKDLNRHPCLVPADVYRPAAIDQLATLGQQLQVPVFPATPEMDPLDIGLAALAYARQQGADILILDTAGRLHIDQQLMAELERLKEKLQPKEILLIADAMTGQDAVQVAEAFDQRLELTGIILTKMDGDARGGAALSMRQVTGKPIKFVGVGEKLDGLEAFHPDRMASRILGMGDVLSLIEKTQKAFDEKQALKLQQKLIQDDFTLEDFRDQLRQIKKLGSLEDILSMLPGIGPMKQLRNLKPDDKELVRTEAIINSMTPEERSNHLIINASRRRRIARGSGTTVQEVNKLLKSYAQMRKTLRKFTRGKKRGKRFPPHGLSLPF